MSAWPFMDKKTRKKRGRRGWAPSDTWNLDTYISQVLAGSLVYFRDHLHGHPGILTEPEWEAILTEMIEGFEAWRDKDQLWTSECSASEWREAEEEAYRKVRKSLRLMHRWFGHLWD